MNPIIVPAITVNIIVPNVVYRIVAVMIFLCSFNVSQSIKNLNIDSSIINVINGSKNVDRVTQKSYVPYSPGDSLDVYNGKSKNDITCVLNFPIAIIIVFTNNCFF